MFEHMKLKLKQFFLLSKIFRNLIDGNWGSWSTWAQCSATCGGGTQTRKRNCDSPAPSNGGTVCVGSGTESQTCNNAACPISMYFKKFDNSH